MAAVILTAVGQAVASRFDLRGIFDPTPGPGHAPTFPAALPLGGAELGTLPVLVGCWQVLFSVAWGGWPFAGIRRRGPRLLAANAGVLGGGCLTYAIAHDAAGVEAARITAVAGAFVAAGLLLGMLFEDWLHDRAAILAGVLVLTAALELALQVYARGRHWTRGGPDEWVAHAGLNAIGVAVILHVGVGRRWPLPGLTRPRRRAARHAHATHPR